MLGGHRHYVGLLCEDVNTHYSVLQWFVFEFWLILLVLKMEQIYSKGVLRTRCDEGVELAIVIIFRVKGEVTVFGPVVYIFQCNVGHVICTVFGVVFNSLVSLSDGSLKP